MKPFFVTLGFVVLFIVAIAGFRGMTSARPPLEIFSDMVRQPKVKAQVPSSFFADGRAARVPVPGTVPLGYAMPARKPAEGSAGPYDNIHFASGTSYLDTGKFEGQWGTGMPADVTPEFIARGRERFSIHCAVCHGATGAGNGIASKFGLITIASLQQPRIRDMADGEIFNTLSNGKNTMIGYGDRIQVPDRWAIIAYLRALHKSQGGATINDVPPAERAMLEAIRR